MTLSTKFLILVNMLTGDWFPKFWLGVPGKGCKPLCSILPSKRIRSRVMWRLQFIIFWCLNDGSLIFLWTWLVLLLIPTSSPLLIIQPDGRRQFQTIQIQQKIVLKFFYARGFLCLECHQWLPLIRAQYTSSVWSALCKFLGIIHSPSTSFHPQSNRIAERFYHKLKVFLLARLSGSNWFHYLFLVLLGLWSIPRED